MTAEALTGILTGTLLEMGKVPREDGPDEPFALMVSFRSAEELRAALVHMCCNLKFQE